MLKYIIIDDEPLAHEIIEEFCSMLSHVHLEKNCYNAMEAMQFLDENTIDFMFLDINMPKLRGLDFLKTLTNPPKTIITTAYKEHALEGFELNVVDPLCPFPDITFLCQCLFPPILELFDAIAIPIRLFLTPTT